MTNHVAEWDSMSPRDKLLTAAGRLRSLAQAADTPGARDLSYFDIEDGSAEWCSGPREGGYRTSSIAHWDEEDNGQRLSYEHANYFSVVHPGVGLALAELLENAALTMPLSHRWPGELTYPTLWLAVADEVMGINVDRALMGLP